MDASKIHESMNKGPQALNRSQLACVPGQVRRESLARLYTRHCTDLDLNGLDPDIYYSTTVTAYYPTIIIPPQ